MCLERYSESNLLMLFGVLLVEDLRRSFKEDRIKNKEGIYEVKWVCRTEGCGKPMAVGNASNVLRYHLATHRKAVQGKASDQRKQGLQQTTLSGTSVTAQKKEKLVKASLDWVVEDYIPFSTFKSSAFKKLMQLINPVVQPPCQTTVRERLHGYRLLLQEQIEKLLSKTFGFGSLTIDDWTSDSGRPFLGVTLHWLDKDFVQHECALDLVPHPYPHDAESIADLVSK